MIKYFKSSVLIFISLISVQFLAQSAGNYLYNDIYSVNNERANIPVNTASGSNVNLKAEILMNVRPSSYTAIFSVTQSGKDVFQVDSMMSGRINEVIYGLGLLGITKSDIHIDAVAMVPTYAQQLTEKRFGKRVTEIPVGFEMKKNIHVLFRDHEVLDGIISEMAFADIYDLVKVEYNIDGLQTYYDELRAAAISVIDSKVATYSAMKMHLDIYSMSDGYTSTYPAERYKSYTAYNTGASFHIVNTALSQQNNYVVDGSRNVVNIDGRPLKDANNQQLVYQSTEKNKTIFYDRMPYNQFDKVIHADIEEPCIQLMYSLVVNYTMMTEEQYLKNKEQIELQKRLQDRNYRPGNEFSELPKPGRRRRR